MSTKRRIAILGGGMAALTTAYELTNCAGWEQRFDITVYQTGWRLGGKGASGVNRAQNDRIEEHGLHIFWGFYENAFRVMREVYGERRRYGSIKGACPGARGTMEKMVSIRLISPRGFF